MKLAVQSMRDLLPGFFFVFCLLALAELSVGQNWISAAIFPPPTIVAKSAWNLIESGHVFEPLLYTLGVLLAGWVLACVMGVLVGFAMGLNQSLHNLFEMLIELIRPIPKPALVPALMLLLGLGLYMELAIIFLGALFPVLIATIQAVAGLDPVRLDVGRSFRVGRVRLFLQIVLPDSLPMIFSGMKVGLYLAIVLAVLAEMLTGTNGMGAKIVELQTAFRAREMYAWVFFVALLGYILVAAFEWLEKRIVFWVGVDQ